MKRFRGFGLGGLLLCSLACSLTGWAGEEERDVAREGTSAPRVIRGVEALELYGVETEAPAQLSEPLPTPVFLFPVQVRVLASVHPYDPDETITELPMFTRPTLNGISHGSRAGTWLGDLEAGQAVVLHTFTPDQISCLVEGDTIQGWLAMGWVACNRLEVGE